MTFVWNIDADGDWDTSGDWTPAGPPTAGSSVVVSTTHLHTITFQTNTVSIGSLSVGDDVFELTGGALTVTSSASFGNKLWVAGGKLELSSLSVNAASFEQDGGIIDGTGTLTVTGAATFGDADIEVETGKGKTLLEGVTTETSSDVALDGSRVLENAGRLNWTSGDFDLGSNPYSVKNVGGGTIKNDSAATFDMQSDSWIYNGAGTNSFTNAGTLEKTVTTGTSGIGVSFINTGVVKVNTGTLVLSGGGSSSASGFTVASGAVLEFGGGTFRLSSGTIAGGGRVDVTGGILELGSTSVASFEQDGGTVDGTGTLTVTGAATFAGADEAETGTGTTLLRGTTTVSNDYGDGVTLDAGRVLENAGTLNWAGSYFYLGYNPHGTTVGGGTIKNDSGATFDIQSDRNVENYRGANSFVNAGILEKTVTKGRTNIEVAFANAGTVSVQTGTLAFDRGGSSSASAFSVASRATLDFSGGAFTMSGCVYNVVGETEVEGNCTINFSAAIVDSFGSQLLMAGHKLALGANSTNVASLEQDSGAINGTGTLTVIGAATFAGYDYEAQTGRGTTLLKGTTTVSGIGYVALDGRRVFENAGTLNWTEGNFYLGYNPGGATVGGATIKNDSGGKFDLESDQSVFSNTGANAFTNAGMLEKTAGDGTTDIQTSFTSTGTVEVNAGTLEFDGTSTFGGLINGSKSVLIDGASRFANLRIGGEVTVVNSTAATSGTIEQTAQIAVGGATGGAKFVNSVDNTYNIDGDFGIGTGTGAGSLFTNSGTLAKTTGSGVSRIGVNVIDTGTIDIASGTLEFRGATNSFGGLIGGDGTLAFNGGGTTLATGAALSIAKWSVSGSSTAVALGEDLAYAGAFAEGAGARLRVANGDTLTFTGAANSFAGAVAGAGTLALGGGATMLAGGATLSVANWSISGGGTSVTLAENLAYGGRFSEGKGSTLNLAGGWLSLTGTAKLRGAVNGSQKLYAKGTTTVAGLSIGGTVELVNSQTMTQADGSVIVGDTNGNAAILRNIAGATYDITDNSDIGRGASTASHIVNAGLFEKIGGTGVSTILPAVQNLGAVDVSSGTLALKGAVSGTGDLGVSGGAIMEADNAVGSGQTLNFTGSGGEFIFHDAQAFAGTVAGFGANDTLDFGAPFTVGTVLSFAEDSGGAWGTLTLTDGSAHASIKLLGSYVAENFHAASSASGTVVTYA